MTAEPTTADVGQVPATRRRRSWRQFSLRTLLVAMLILSVCFALFAWRLQRARRQAAAVATIRKLGGVVTYDYQLEAEKKGKTVAESPMLPWLIHWLGDDFFHEVVYTTMNNLQPKSDDDVRAFWSAVSQLSQLELFQASGKWLNGRMATEAVGKHHRLTNLHLTVGSLRGGDLAPLAGLTNLETLALYQNPIGDDAAKYLGSFPKLKYANFFITDLGDDCLESIARNKDIESLQVNSTQVSDRGLAHLAALPKLRVLMLGQTKVTDDGLRHLTKLRRLEALGLSRTDVTDRGLVHLAALENLQSLDVGRTQVTGTAFRQLQSFSKLENLMMADSPVVDEGALWAARLPRLKLIALSGSRVTNESLDHIQWPGTLESVMLNGTGLTDEGLMRLANCPSLNVVYAIRTDVTPEGLKRFETTRPGLKVFWASRGL